jgi:hypothetical protein
MEVDCAGELRAHSIANRGDSKWGVSYYCDEHSIYAMQWELRRMEEAHLE